MNAPTEAAAAEELELAEAYASAAISLRRQGTPPGRRGTPPEYTTDAWHP